MAHLVVIDKGPVMDWTNELGLDECYRKWKKCYHRVTPFIFLIFYIFICSIILFLSDFRWVQ